MNLRPWKFEDLSEIERLERECFPSAPWNRRALTDCFLSERFYGVLSEEGGKIAAYGGISWLLDEAEVLLIATAELYRRCGRGQEILSALLAEAKRQAGKVLWLNPIPERKWGYVRSIQTVSSLCQMAPCSTLEELARACSRLMRQ